MKPRVLILPISAAIIFGLVLWRMNRESSNANPTTSAVAARRLAPRFELYDQHSQLVKFERYLGRTRLLVLFIADSPADKHPHLQQLAENHAAIEDAGVQVVVVGTETPFATREAEQRRGEPFPFPILSDISQQTPEPTPAHRRWGLVVDDSSQEIREGLFLIGRDGTASWAGSAPHPMSDPTAMINAIASGDWPM